MARPRAYGWIGVLAVTACGGTPLAFSGESSVLSTPVAFPKGADEEPRFSKPKAVRQIAEEPESEHVGRVLPEMMVAAVRAQSKTFTACMVGQHGSATFAITVAADGSVLRVDPSESSIAEAPMKCLIAAWFRAVFPPPIGSARARAVIPLVFK